MAPRSAWERSSSGLYTVDPDAYRMGEPRPLNQSPLRTDWRNFTQAINYAWEEAPMRMVLSIAALVSIAFGLIAVGRAWYEFRPLTDKERARLRQEGN